MGLILLIFFCTSISMASRHKNTKVILDLLTEFDILLMVKKAIRGEICHAIYRYVKVNNKHMKNCDKNKESSYFKYWNENNLYGWVVSQKLTLGGVKWIEETSQFNENLIKSCNEYSDIGYFLEVDIQYTEELHKVHNGCPFCLKK